MLSGLRLDIAVHDSLVPGTSILKLDTNSSSDHTAGFEIGTFLLSSPVTFKRSAGFRYLIAILCCLYCDLVICSLAE